MTQRAQRAADELRRRGWQIDAPDDGPLNKDCSDCGYCVPRDARYCQQCGARVSESYADDSLTDIEAAIAAALGEGAPQ